MADQEQIIVKLDSQIANSIELCGARYEMEHVLNMRPLTKPPALEKGSCMHDMLAHYYRAKRDERYNKEAGQVVQECLMIGREACARTSIPIQEFEEEDIPAFKNYILHHQYDGWIIHAVEEPFSKVLYEDAMLMIIYEGIVDLRVTDPRDEWWTVDHKSESRKSHPFELSNQFEGYQWAFSSGVCINKVGYQSSLADKERFRRYFHKVSDVLIDEWKADIVGDVQKALEWHRTEYFPRNRTSCDKYSGCIFKRVCKSEPQVREHILQAHFFKDKPWDPFTRDTE